MSAAAGRKRNDAFGVEWQLGGDADITQLIAVLAAAPTIVHVRPMLAFSAVAHGGNGVIATTGRTP